jgi:hypothetical protein
MRYKYFSYFFLLLFFISLFGCGNGMKKMSGRVTYSDNNEPLERGFVCFVNEKNFARGTIKEDGCYTIGSFTEKDGLPLGVYHVYVEAKKPIGSLKPDADDVDYEPLVNLKFSRPETSGLTFDVKNSNNKFDFQLERYQKKIKTGEINQ